MSAHPHSMTALQELRAERRISQRSAQILLWMLAHPGAWTDREVAARMGFPDMNCVRPRISELVGDGLLIEVDAVRCPITGKTVRRTAPEEPQGELLF